MITRTHFRTHTFAGLSLCALLLICAAGARAQQGQMTMPHEPRADRRRETTIQTSRADAGPVKDAVSVRYLNLPWGEQTFGYIETGNDPRNQGYYAARTWPIAHLTLTAPATYEGHHLAPGDYAFIITPANARAHKGMMLSLAAFKPDTTGGTFLKPGNVFVETPAGATVIASKPITFTKGAPVVDHLVIETAAQGAAVALNFHYGDRTLTEKLMVK